MKNHGYLPKDASTLLGNARHLSSDMDVIVRDARVSKKYLEFDISINKKHLEALLDNLYQIADIDHVKQVVEETIEKEDAIKDGISYFNNERFWECHEAFEGVWNQCYGREKELVQGIILVAVAFAHEQANEESIGVGMLGRALEKLGTSPSMYHSIDVDRIRTKTIEMQRAKKLTRFLLFSLYPAAAA